MSLIHTLIIGYLTHLKQFYLDMIDKTDNPALLILL